MGLGMKPTSNTTSCFGSGRPCVLIAEIGINHNGDLALAEQMIMAAAAAGADAVKFQNYRTDDFISDRSLTYEYVSQGKQVVESQYDLFKRCELGTKALREMAAMCHRAGVTFFSTPTNPAGIRTAMQAGAPWLKNGSDYLGHLPLIRAMAKTGLPTLLSTGMATLAEIDDAVRAFRGAEGGELVLLVCTSSYPTPAADVHLRRIAAMRDAFGCPIGFSDHTEGIVAAVGAVALGACCIEKHFTLSRDLPGPDHRFSSEPAEFRRLVNAVREMEQSLGSPVLGFTEAELTGKAGFQLSCVAARELPAGRSLRAGDIAFRRPGSGLPPKAADWLRGRKLAHKVPRGHVFQPADFS